MSMARWIAQSSLVALLAVGVNAQTTSRLSGSVVDPSGAPVLGAEVKVQLAGVSAPIAVARSTADGAFAFIALNPGTFDLSVEAAGFAAKILRDVRIESARELSLPPIPLTIVAVAETVDVQAEPQSVQTTNGEISNSITNEQFRNLPQLNRSVTALLRTQPGVTNNGRSSTTVNGLRPAYLNITYEGVNIQDNSIRTNTADYQPLRLFTDQVAELTVTTSNANVTNGAGAAQINYIAPSGGNEFHGSLYWTNRNNAFAANSWFNNRDGVNLPFLNQNQFGGTFGGPVVRNKLFFFSNVEVLRNRQQTSVNRTILTETARNGVFIYPAAGGTARGNVLQLAGVPYDAVARQLIDQLPPSSAANNYDVGDSRPGDIRNTIGHRFVTRNNQDRTNAMGKLDWYLTDRNAVTATYSYADDMTDRPDLSFGTGYGPVPPNFNGSKVNFLSLGWRSNARPSLTNEFRFGFNRYRIFLDSQQQVQPFLVDPSTLLFDSPVSTFLPQGRNVATFNINNNTAWIKGRHTVQFGVNYMPQRIELYDYENTLPLYTLDVGLGHDGLSSGSLPGISAAEFGRANSLLANLGGLIDNATQNFNITSRNSGFVPGAANRRNYNLDTWGLYITDNYRVSSRLHVNYGVRWEYISVFDERDSLALLPDLIDGNYLSSLFRNATLNFAGKSAGRPFYNPDRNNFAPNISLAWSPRGDGKTAIRAAYSVHFVQDSQSTAVLNSVDSNSGLRQGVQDTSLSSTLSRPTILATPEFHVPRTFADNHELDNQTFFAMPDPNLRSPYVQQWNFSIQQNLAGGILEARYVGNKATKSFRAFDFNQVNIHEQGFLDEFRRAYGNGVAAQGATGVFDPRYNAAIPGSVPLPLLNTFLAGGFLTNAYVRSLIQTQQVGELAHTYQISGIVPDGFSFYQNPLALGLNVMTNYSNSSYHALQLDYTRRLRGAQFQANYVYGKVLSDTAGDGAYLFEPFLDFGNSSIERARTPFDVTHALKGNFFYELPVGKGRRWNAGWANWIVGGWGMSGILTYQSGSPFSIMSHRATLNRDSRSADQNGNTAISNLNKSQLDRAVGFRMTGNGPMIVDSLAIGPDGRGVNEDGKAPFTGQAFFHPEAGTLGTLQRRMFSGPTWFNFDFAAQKSFQFTERYSLQFRMASTNFFNNATFFAGPDETGDQIISSVNFGVISGLQTQPRRIQFELFFRF